MSSRYHSRGDSRTPLGKTNMNTIPEEHSMELSGREMNVLELAVRADSSAEPPKDDGYW